MYKLPKFITITIRVPIEQLYIHKNGSIALVSSLTKSNEIIIKPDDHIIHPEIHNHDEKLRTKTAKLA